MSHQHTSRSRESAKPARTESEERQKPEKAKVRKVSFNMSEERFREFKAMAQARNVSMTEIFAEGIALSDLVNRYRDHSLVFRKIEIRHAGSPGSDKCPGISFASGRYHIRQVRTHVTAESIKLMAGNTVVILKNLLTATSCSANWLIVGGGRSAGIDRGRVNDEGDAKRAKYGLFLDYAVPLNNG